MGTQENEQPFRTHAGRYVGGQELRCALSKVAQDWRDLGRAIRREDCYASHVTEVEKDEVLRDMLVRADEIEAGDIGSFTIWQRVNEALTGECVPLFSKEPVARIEFDFTDCDDSGAQTHVVEPATADEVEAAITAFFAEFTAPRLTREMRT